MLPYLSPVLAFELGRGGGVLKGREQGYVCLFPGGILGTQHSASHTVGAQHPL